MKPNALKIAAAIALLTLLAIAQTANAQPSGDDRAKAIAHYDQGEAYFKAGTYDKAVDEYQKSYALVPAPLLLFNIALAQEYRKNRAEAIEHYDKYLAAEPNGVKADEARARNDKLKRARDNEATAAAQREAEIKQRRARADQLVTDGKHLQAVGELRALHALINKPTLIFEIAEAYRNGNDEASAMTEYRTYLETSDDTHAAEAQTRWDELKAAEKKRIEDAQKGPVGPVGPPEKPSILLPAGVSGAALALVGVGAIFGLRANSLESELRSELDERRPPVDSSDPRFDDGRSAAITADIFYGIGAAAAIGAGFLWYRYLAADGQERPRTVVVPTGRGAAVMVSF